MTTEINTTRQSLRDKAAEVGRLLSDELSIYTAESDAIQQHAGDRNNPHQTTKEQLALLYLENYPVATTTQVADGLSSTAYVTVGQLGDALTEHMPEPTATSFIRTPTIQQPMVDEDEVSLTPVVGATLFTFTPGSGVSFGQREYQIDLSEGDWSSPIASWLGSTDQPSTCPVTLNQSTEYKVRVRDYSQGGSIVSEWSPGIIFTTGQ